MDGFTTLTGVAAPLPIINIDTDMLAPGESMKTVSKTGLARYLFADMRYRPDGSEDPKFVLNKPAYREATILVAGDNFGCGSSREHAVWCLKDFGIRCVIAPSFADIFSLNAIRNGLLLISFSKDVVDLLVDDASKGANATFTIDLPSQQVTRPNGETLAFEVDPFRKSYLMNGMTDAALVAGLTEVVGTFEADQRRRQPWLWTG